MSIFGEQRAFLALLLDHVSDCVVAVDADGYIVFINRPYCRLLGGDPADFIGRRITEAVSPETKLHLVATGSPPILGAPLNVKGHNLITRQVPIKYQNEVIGAVGVALFSDTRQAVALAREIAPNGVQIPITSAWSPRYDLADYVGSDVLVSAVREQAIEAAELDFPVLLLGETGTGKEIIAQAIHGSSKRSRAPFVSVNCATIPKDLLESELFGYEGGSFTGARHRGAQGRFEIAHGGTIFLDEIGEMPMQAQAALLRVLQEHYLVRVGGNKPVSIDVRVICATHRDLHGLSEKNAFRLDLLHRIDVMRIRLPSLRERNDKEELAEYFLHRTCRELNVAVPALSDQAKMDLETQRWPGNARELDNVITRALLRTRRASTNVLESLEATVCRDDDERAEPQFPGPPGDGLVAQRDRFERELVRSALKAANGRVTAAAELLEISRVTLYKKMERFGLNDQFGRERNQRRT